MERKQLTFEQVFDLRAVRIVTATRGGLLCRARAWCMDAITYIPGEFDDYIATPKDNFYRSIHTAVLGPEGKAVEVQIRTREMHDQAELGLAAHWRYKESRAHDVSYDRKIEWVRKLLDADRQDARRRSRLPRRGARRAVRGSRLRAHAQGRGRGPAAGRHAARFRVPRAYRPRTPLPRRARQRAHRAADPRAGQWRDRRDHHAQASAAQPRLVVRDRGLPGQPAQPLQGARLVPEVRRGRRRRLAPLAAPGAGARARAATAQGAQRARPRARRCCWAVSKTCRSALRAAARR